MIRVTHSGLTNLINYQLSNFSSRMRVVEEQAVSGQKINRPSDDPAATSEVHRLYGAIEDQNIYQQNATQAQSMLDLVDNALSGVSDALMRIRELAVNMSSDTVTANERSNAATEVSQLYSQLLDLANSDVNGRYLFAGTTYNAAPFTAAGVYQGDNNIPATQVGSNQWVTNGYDGSQVFQGNIDVFNVLNTFIAALQTNNVVAIQNTISNIDTAQIQNSQWRADAGASFNEADDALNVAEGMGQLYNQRLDEVMNIDETEVYLTLNDLRNTYESTIRVASSASQVNLIDLL